VNPSKPVKGSVVFLTVRCEMKAAEKLANRTTAVRYDVWKINRMAVDLLETL
jgi:hypothetical protein